MSNRMFAVILVGLSVLLGWLWQIAVAHGLAVGPLACAAELLLMVWLWRRLDRNGNA